MVCEARSTLEIESCSGAWREARRKEDCPVCVDRRIKERRRWDLARSVVSGAERYEGRLPLSSRSVFGKKIVEVCLVVAVGPPDVTAVFVIRSGRQSLRLCVASRPIYFWLSGRWRVAGDRTLFAARSTVCCT